MQEKYYYIKNIEGTLCYKDESICEFKIENYALTHFKDLSNRTHYPWELYILGISYGSFNEFFNHRVVKEYAMFIREYLKEMGLDHYDFDELIKRNNGASHTLWWIKFENIGARNWDELEHTRFPIYTSEADKQAKIEARKREKENDNIN